jgi:GH25 family lysozyme M1 (1,4-beta-N-acetylmuramidase)
MPTWPRRSALGAVLTTVLASAAVALAAPPAAQAATLTISGVDVAGYQHPGYQGRCKGTDTNSIDWKKVAASGQQFAIIKATESTTCTNPYLATDTAQARAAGLVVGTYHFARPAYELKTATQQAKYYVKVAGTMRTPGTLPPVLDIESDGGLTKARLGKWTQRFLDRVQEYTGRTPIIYSYGPFLDSEVGNLNNLARYPLWLARYRSTPPTADELPGAWTRWTFWQHTSSGRVPGIEGNVDVNWFDGTREQLLALASGSGTYAVAPDAPQSVVPNVMGKDVKLTWDAPGNDGGSPVQSYAVSIDGVLDGYTPTRSYVAMNLPPGEHTFAVRAVNAIGTGPAASTTLTLAAPLPGSVEPPPAATTVAINAQTRTTTGATQQVSVTLRRADTQQTLGDRKLSLTVTPKAGGSARTVKLVSDTQGNAVVPVQFRAHTTLAAQYGGTVRLQPTSASSYVRVQPVVTVTQSKKKLRKGYRATLKGRVDRLYAGDRVVVQLRRSGTWKVKARSTVGAAGKFRFKVAPAKIGKNKYRLVIRSAPAHLSGTSKVMTIKVLKPRKKRR